jgi:RNA-directed DNA polymerase
MNTAIRPMYEWNAINWTKVQRNVFKLQKRIYQASMRGDIISMRKLQKLLLKSNAAKLLAVRKVTQDNQGKKTAGVDGIRKLTPVQRMKLSNQDLLEAKVKPTRRIWIPKPNSNEKRPLGIPVMKDRAAQALVKLALEPEWESRFEPNSYGFRPGRSVHDAIEAIFLSIKSKPKYVLDADIEKCFDKISHEKLLTKLNTIPSLRRLIRAWLKAGVLEDGVFNQTEQGTPQGGVISPLLANIALHGMEQIVKDKFPVRGGPIFIRYADDFLVFHKDLAVINHCKAAIESWLADIDLNLKEEKTRIAHTLLQDEHGNRGFDFLGMHIGQYNVGKTHSGKSNYGKPLGFKTFIRPSKKSQKKQHKAIQNIVRRNRTIEQERLIEQLNPVIRGWSKFHSTVVSKRVFSNMSHKLFQSLRRWANRRHPNKTQTWVNRKYWRLETGRWTFAARKGKPLRLYSETPIIRHVKVKENRSPYDGDWSYWGARLGRYPTLSNRKAMLLRKQKGRCSICKLQFTLGDDMDTDHVIPLHLGGKDIWANVQLLHAHCHITKTRKDSLLHIND